MAVSFAISEYSGWQALTDGHTADAEPGLIVAESPDVSIIPPLLRRRLNLLGRACASEVLKHLAEGEQTPIVYCSQHGDIERTVSVLSELAGNEPVSPMGFSLAVHNAICGVLSIQIGLNANISAISAGAHGLAATLLEAAGVLMEGAEKVLCVICDVPLPLVYRDEQSLPERAFSVCFVMTKEQGILCELQQCEQEAEPVSPVGLLHFLSSDQRQLLLGDDISTWRLSKV